MFYRLSLTSLCPFLGVLFAIFCLSLLYICSFSYSCNNLHWLNGDHVTLLEFKYIPIGTYIPSRIHWGERDQWQGKASDQNVTKAGGVIVAWCFEAHFSVVLGNLSLVVRKFLKHSRIVWGLNRRFLPFIRRTESKKHLEKDDFENAWNVRACLDEEESSLVGGLPSLPSHPRL